MSLPSLKCWPVWRLYRLPGSAAAFCVHSPQSPVWRQAVRQVWNSRTSVCVQNEHLPASYLYKILCRVPQSIHLLPQVHRFSAPGQTIQTCAISNAAISPFSPCSSSQRKHTPSIVRDCQNKMLTDSTTCCWMSHKPQTCNITQNVTRTLTQARCKETCTKTPIQVELTSKPVRDQFVRRQKHFWVGKNWGGITCIPHQTAGVLHCSRLTAVTKQAQRRYATDVHKSVSALTVKRPLRKKMPKVAQEETEPGDLVVAYAVAEELNLAQLKEALVVQGLYMICPLPIDAQDALHVQAKYTVDEKKREIFFFRDGSAVFWSMPEVERKEALKFIRKHDIGRYAPNLILKEKEEMDLKLIRGPTGVSGDTLQLNETQEEGQSTLEKYAFSNALGQSVKLAIWEASLEKFVDSIEPVTEDLRDGQKISMSRREVLRKTGELFALRHLINLDSDLLDTPDFYWDRAVLEPLYMAVYNHLDIARRTKVMNEKLSHCCELMELLTSHLNDAHHTRLEVMIIVLILVEVVFEIIHYIERYISDPSSPASLSDPAPQGTVTSSPSDRP